MCISGRLCLLLLLALAAPHALHGQGTDAGRIPDEDFYLMPAFGEGTVYLRGQGPAQGRINICAVDQTLRFINDDGTELSAVDQDAIARVQIDTVWFLRSGGAFYRMYPVSNEIGIALRRDTKIIRDVEAIHELSFQTLNTILDTAINLVTILVVILVKQDWYILAFFALCGPASAMFSRFFIGNILQQIARLTFDEFAQ